MSNFAIRVENLSKLYQIGQRESYKTLRDTLSDAAKRPFQKVRSLIAGDGTPQSTDETLWALKDVSFEVQPGEVVGIIGRNGAGKSTLLKVLSRVTEPTSGRVEGYGRVGSLLEVGTGFHPELTGRENVYLNGAILGMGRAEIAKKFDEIVAFAEIDRFLDTPVKRYSSGMYIRLAFAVAAHLEPEILIVDEVLAVGDAAFQKKCLGKMGDVTKEGRTVLFVSHNMIAMQSLCSRAIWLDKGQIIEQGQSGRVVSQYLQTSFLSLNKRIWNDKATAPGNEKIRMRYACVRPVDGSSSDPITIRTNFVMEFEYWNLDPDARLHMSLELYNEQDIQVFDVSPTHKSGWQGRAFHTGLYRDRCYVPGDLLNEGMYRVKIHLIKDQSNIIYFQDDILAFEIQESIDMRGAWYGKWEGVIRPILEWKTEAVELD